jgi:uncharacterized protein YukE
MAERETVQVQPEAMHVASQALSSAAKDLHTRLIDLDGQVRDLLTGWRGWCLRRGVGFMAPRRR